MLDKQTKDNTKHVNIKMPIELYENIDLMATKSERKISQQIRYMLQKYIEMQENFNPNKPDTKM